MIEYSKHAETLDPSARWVVAAAVAAAFMLLFYQTMRELAADWMVDPEYGHGLLLAPLAGYMAWRARLQEAASPARVQGLVVLAIAVILFWLGTIAAEFFTRRLALVLGLIGLALFFRGRDQARAWWLPFGLLVFTIPIPEVVLNSITLPLQLLASRIAVVLLRLRHVPADLAGNIIILPGRELFVAEACSGLRSISALLGMSLLIGGTALSTPWGRVALLVIAIPAALAANAFRVFTAGYLVYFIGPETAEGALHLAAGLLVFLAALGLVAAAMVLVRRLERRSSEGSE